ncbi:MAG: hypothetical protein ACTSRA_17035, partial [Promethearchaeota archaeon]
MKPVALVSERVDSHGTIERLLNYFRVNFKKIQWDDFVSDESSRYSGYLLLSSSYPAVREPTADEINKLKELLNSGVPIFCEYLPVPGLISNNVLRMPYGRIVSLREDDRLFKGIPKLSLLEPHQNPFLEVTAAPPDLVEYFVMARVAGCYKADFGLPDRKKKGKVRTIIARHGSLLFSAIKISTFHEMEFRPKDLWIRLLLGVIKFILKNEDGSPLKTIEPDVKTLLEDFDMREITIPLESSRNSPLSFELLQKNLKRPKKIITLYQAYAKKQKPLRLDDDRRHLYIRTIKRALDWFQSSGVLLDDGMLGVCEGFSTGFLPDGKKELNETKRADCTTDTAFAFALARYLPAEGDGLSKGWREKCHAIGMNLFEISRRVFQFDDFSVRRGFFAWSFHPYAYNVFYSDDNGRCIYEHLLFAILGLKKGETFTFDFFKRGLKGMIALMKTWCKNGHRWRRIDLKHFWSKGGRAGIRKRKTRRYGSPHYESNSQSAALLGASLMKDDKIVSLVARGIDDYMKRLGHLNVEHSFNDDFSKLLLALAFLVKASESMKDQIDEESRRRYKNHLKLVVSIFGWIQDACGAIPERDLTQGKKFKEDKNEKYGTGEVSVYTKNTDTITDQLYSTSFLAVALYFAWKTGECPEEWNILIKLLDYLCAIQCKSSNPQLDGAWMRGFDYEKQEYFGANGDIGWGAYSIETGWMVAVIVSALELVLLDLDPFESLPHDIQTRLIQFYNNECMIQE